MINSQQIFPNENNYPLKISVIAERKGSFIVIDKPAFLPSAPLIAGDSFSAVSQASVLYPEIKLVKGKRPFEYGLLHRLDTATRGLLLIALSQESYDFLQNSQRSGLFTKTYLAFCDYCPDIVNKLPGFPRSPDIPILKNGEGLLSSGRSVETNSNFTVKSSFRAFGKGNKSVRPVTSFSSRAALKKCLTSKEYTTEITRICIQNNTLNNCDIFYNMSSDNTFLCTIKNGFRHQVRCHLAWCGYPVKGDNIYNPLSSSFGGNSKIENQNQTQLKENLLFYAVKISFPNQSGGGEETFSLPLQDKMNR